MFTLVMNFIDYLHHGNGGGASTERFNCKEVSSTQASLELSFLLIWKQMYNLWCEVHLEYNPLI